MLNVKIDQFQYLLPFPVANNTIGTDSCCRHHEFTKPFMKGFFVCLIAYSKTLRKDFKMKGYRISKYLYLRVEI